MKFYDRIGELDELERIHILCGHSTHFTVITGRRRVGKTRLVEEYIRGRRAIYFFVTKKEEGLLLENFSTSVRAALGYSPQFKDWEEAFEYIMTQVKDELIVVLDEFQNLSYGSPSAFSQIQKMIDRYKDTPEVHFVVLGSYVSLIKRIFMDKKEPLFGRADEFLSLGPLDFPVVLNITKDLGFSPQDAFVLYSVFGGIPKYYVMIEKQNLGERDVVDILGRGFFCDFPLLADEVKSTLIENFGGKYHMYFSILEAVASGNNTLTEIANKTGILRDSLSKYLAMLRDDFKVLEYLAPITDEVGKSKRGRYFISDELTNFWFKVIYPNLSFIESGNYSQVKTIVKRNLPILTGRATEGLVRWLVGREMGYERVGPWWNRKGDEIDLIGIDTGNKRILFGEVKWTNRKTGVDVIEALIGKTDIIDRYDDYHHDFLLVSKNGFTKAAMKLITSQGIIHWDGNDLIRMMEA